MVKLGCMSQLVHELYQVPQRLTTIYLLSFDGVSSVTTDSGRGRFSVLKKLLIFTFRNQQVTVGQMIF